LMVASSDPYNSIYNDGIWQSKPIDTLYNLNWF
jgi:hypothetical protein